MIILKNDRGSGNGGVVSLERAHVYSVDKQQVSIIQVGNCDLKQVPNQSGTGTSCGDLPTNSKTGL